MRLRPGALASALLLAPAALIGALLLSAPAVQGQEACPLAHVPGVALPHAQRSVGKTEQLHIVALGSSTTQGWMATSPANAYPSQLQADLSARFPRVHVTVLNRGIGGQDAAEELLRIDSDAIAAKPAIVIWQVGANGALRHSDPELFKSMVGRGVERMKAAGIDVILMDNQRSPMILASPEHTAIDAALAELAKRDHVELFSRGALMDEWQRNGAPYAQFISPDNLHHNDLGYRCLAAAVAESIEKGLAVTEPGKDSAVSASRQ